jgi:hypothetical protein
MSTLFDSAADASARTYEVKTHGCQMNVHDSERLAGLLSRGDSCGCLRRLRQPA